MQEQLWLEGFEPTVQQKKLQEFVDGMIDQMEKWYKDYDAREILLMDHSNKII